MLEMQRLLDPAHVEWLPSESFDQGRDRPLGAGVVTTGQPVVVETAGLAMTMATRLRAFGLTTFGSCRLISFPLWLLVREKSNGGPAV